MYDVAISQLGEFATIDRILKKTSHCLAKSNILVGPGDDAFVCKFPGSYFVCTTDILIEGIHFLCSWQWLFKKKEHFFRALGYKCLAINISDLSAMGDVKPLYCCTGLGLPGNTPLKNLNSFYSGLTCLAKRHSIDIIGGDTNASPLWVVSITLIGTATRNKIVRRSGAKPSDYIYTTGNSGESAAGLEILQKGKIKPDLLSDYLIRKHLYPPIKLKQARIIAPLATSMIDSSDGLFSSIEQLCKASGTGAEIYADNLPVSKQLREYSKNFTKAMDFALYGGEDYELVFTSRQQKIPAVQHVSRVGRITKTKGIRLYSGEKDKKELEIKKVGFEHFRNKNYQFSS